MRVSIIGTVGIPAKYGGFETLANYLTKNLANKFDFTVYCSARAYVNKLKTYNGANLKYINLNANGVYSILYDIISLFKSLRNSDVLLILGVSGCIILPLVKLFSKKKIILNIDGLEWKRAKWGKFAKWFLKFSENIGIKFSDEIITDNKVITDYVKNEYNINSHLIAYGADHVTKEKFDNNFLKKFPFAKKKYAFKVCRIEPENNIHIILEAFSKIKDQNIVCVGNWTNSFYGKNLRSIYKNKKNIFLLDPIYNQKVLNQFRSNCSIYIHGHSAGGTNPSLVEAMYLGLPIITFGINYNIETTHNKAAYFKCVDELLLLLKELKHESIKSIAKNMRIIAKENYTWSHICKRYGDLFNKNNIYI